jgi:hypothetical protein
MTMIDYEQRLIAFYSEHEVDAVRTQPGLIEHEFDKSVEELSADPTFVQIKNFVETQRLYIEDRHSNWRVLGPRAQVAGCLKMLLNQAMFPDEARAMFERKMDIQKRLLIEMYGGNWSEQQRAHFEYMFGALMTWKSYFLSYTNDAAPIINARFNRVILRHVDSRVRGARDKARDNLLADAIVERLRVRNVQSCFYDKTDIAVGQKLSARIQGAIDNVFAFIQLIQTETFYAVMDNWSFREWESFKRGSTEKLEGRAYFRDVFEERFAAILADNNANLRNPNIPDNYRQWHDLIFTETHHLELPTDPEKFDTAMKTLAGRIVNLQHEIVATVPS